MKFAIKFDNGQKYRDNDNCHLLTLWELGIGFKALPVRFANFTKRTCQLLLTLVGLMTV